MRSIDRTVWASILIPTTTISIAEALFFIGDLEDTMFVHAINIVLCLIIPLLTSWDSRMFQVFAALSLLRLLNLGMPSFFDLTLYWLPLIYLPLIIIGVMMMLDDVPEGTRRKTSSILFGSSGPRPMALVKQTLAAVIIGLFLATIEYAILGNDPMVPDASLESLLLLLGVMLLCVGFGEEMLFRGLLIGRGQEHIGLVGAILLSSLLFAVMHSGYSSGVYMIYVFLVSFVFGYIYHRTQSIYTVTVLHGTLNFFLFSLIPMGLLW